MNRVLRFFSRISIRLMAFNLLLVFLPVAGIFFLVSYEERLVEGQRRAMETEAKLLAATLGEREELQPDAARNLLRPMAQTTAAQSGRIQVVDRDGAVVADTLEFARPLPQQSRQSTAIRRNVLYRLGAFLARPVLRLFRSDTPLEESELYERADRLDARTEVRVALQGRYNATERLSPGGRAVILYSAAPVQTPKETVGAVVVSQSTSQILEDLYAIRLSVVRIFAASLLVAIGVSLLVATTIVRPLRQLRIDAGAILDRRGRLKGRFRGSSKLDEIGDLARALERLNKRLENHLGFMETFASDVSHEFKNPLASIRVATEMLYEAEDETQRKRFLSMVEQDIARMERLLSAVREVSSIDAQIANEPREDVAVEKVLERVVEGFRLRAVKAGFDLQVAGAPLLVSASDVRLMQVFENILDNAVSFSSDGGAVRIRAATEGQFVVVRISDAGPGIPPAHIDRIFDRFFSYRPGGEKKHHTGLGLAIVKSVVEGYGGTVNAFNNDEGGATFEVTIPRKGVAVT